MEHVLRIRVHYEDTDAGGVVYHGRYLGFCDRGRSELLLESGYDLYGRHGRGEMIVVVEARLVFKKPARLGDVIEVRTACGGLGRARATAHQRIFRGDDLLVEAWITAACVDGAGRPRRLPADFVEVMERYLEEGAPVRRGR